MSELEMLREAARLMRAAADSRWSAVADLLDAWARLGALSSDFLSRVGGPEAVAVARAYLRREP